MSKNTVIRYRHRSKPSLGMISEYQTPELMKVFIPRWSEGIPCKSSLGEVRKISIQETDRYLLIPVAKERRFVYLWHKQDASFQACT